MSLLRRSYIFLVLVSNKLLFLNGWQTCLSKCYKTRDVEVLAAWIPRALSAKFRVCNSVDRRLSFLRFFQYDHWISYRSFFYCTMPPPQALSHTEAFQPDYCVLQFERLRPSLADSKCSERVNLTLVLSPGTERKIRTSCRCAGSWLPVYSRRRWNTEPNITARTHILSINI
jgi:hypothetical protein